MTAFGDALTQGNADAVASHIHEQGWFRDMLTFTWDMRSLTGHSTIKSYLADTLARAKILDVQLDTCRGFAPVVVKMGSGPELVETAFTFETAIAHGQGIVKLFTPVEEQCIAKAFLVVIMVSDWKGHEEMAYKHAVPDGHTLAWGN